MLSKEAIKKMSQFLWSRRDRETIRQINNKMIGGAYVTDKKLTINFSGKEYTFYLLDSEIGSYVLYSKDHTNHCVTIIIDKEKRRANIMELSPSDGCITSSKPGMKLVLIALNLLIKYKDQFNLKEVTVVDHSYKKCGKVNIKLEKMATLLTGETWYGKFGFRPYAFDTVNDVYYKDSASLYSFNKKTMNTTKVKEFDLAKYFKKDDIPTEIYLLIKEKIDKNPEMLVKDLLSWFMHSDFEKHCTYFAKTYENIARALNLNFSLIYGIDLTKIDKKL